MSNLGSHSLTTASGAGRWTCLWRVALVLVVAAGVASAGGTAQAQPARLQDHIDALTAAEMTGRGNATEGIDQARDYLARHLVDYGLEPAGTDGYLSPFEAVVGIEGGERTALRLGERVLADGVGFRPASFSDTTRFSGEVHFAGYGLSAPAFGYDDYAGVDVRGRVVLVLTGAPAPIAQALADSEAAYLMTPASKAAVAYGQGAAAVLIANDPRTHGPLSDQQPDALPALRPEPALDGIATVFLRQKAAARLVADAGLDLAGLQEQIDAAGVPVFEPLGVVATGEVDLERRRRTLYNVVGRLAGDDSRAPIVLGAHYDGLGLGAAASLSAHGVLHPGADDNASAVAVLLELARRVGGSGWRGPPLVFAFFAGEEIGLRGSRRLVRELGERHEAGLAINMDMVGRLRDEVVYAGLEAPDGPLGRLLGRAARAHGLSLRVETAHRRHSDHLSFRDEGWRTLHLTTGRHADYHLPSDTPDTVDVVGMARVLDLLEQLVRQLAR